MYKHFCLKKSQKISTPGMIVPAYTFLGYTFTTEFTACPLLDTSPI